MMKTISTEYGKQIISDLPKCLIGDCVLITAPTGAGKSYFIINDLLKYAEKNKKKILYTIPRQLPKRQLKQEVENNTFDYNIIKNNIDIENTYLTELDWYYLSHNEYITFNCIQAISRFDFDMSEFDYIVIDEAHLLVPDSVYNQHMQKFFDTLVKTDAVPIFITATPEPIEQLICDAYFEIFRYELTADNSMITSINYYPSVRGGDLEQLQDICSNIKEKKEKAIVMTFKRADALTLHKQFDNSLFVCAKDRAESEYTDTGLLQQLIRNNKIDKQFIFCTSVLDVGFSLIDSDIKHIVCFNNADITTIKQTVGRKRMINDTDTVTLYLKELSNKQIAGLFEKTRCSTDGTKLIDYYHKYISDTWKAIYDTVSNTKYIDYINKYLSFVPESAELDSLIDRPFTKENFNEFIEIVRPYDFDRSEPIHRISLDKINLFLNVKYNGKYTLQKRSVKRKTYYYLQHT